MKHINFHQLRIFYTVAGLGSFSKASEQMFISQPAVSVQVKSLEDALGTSLFERSGRTIRLTDPGEVVFDYARRIFNLTDGMLNALRDISGLKTGRLVIGASTTPGDYLLPEIIGQFKQRYPGIEIELKTANSARIVSQLLQHEIALGFIGEPVERDELELVPFRKDEIVLFTPPDHDYAQVRVIASERLEKEQLILREKGSATRRWAEESLRALDISYSVAMELGSNEAVKNAVAAGLGVGILSRCAVQREITSGLLSLASVGGLRIERWLYLAFDRQAHQTSAEKAFIEMALGP